MQELNRDSFKSIEELTKWADDGHLSRADLQVIYDSLPGAPSLKRLRNRPCAIERIWAERERLPEAQAAQAKATEPPKKKSNRGAIKVLVLEMMGGGATIKDLISATGWQPHSLRGYISTMKKSGLSVDTRKENGETVYRMVGA